ncbi:MAG TPA: anthranilate phosphoribosyltransferase [Phycisphaerales bacterium]|nr:anthranilate phosphoribosyltransferase [Phycisphaerales bacterium]
MEIITRLVTGETMSEQDAETLFLGLLGGELDEAQIGAVLALIEVRGATVEELVGGARAMRANVQNVPFECPPGQTLIDTCGTGGTPKAFNVSTAAAIVAAACKPGANAETERVNVAKHGSRSRTGRGSAEVLGELGVNVDASPEAQARCLREIGVCFCFAIHHHPAMRFAAGPRKSLGVPTVFNLLGPLTNPARASRQLIGVYEPRWVEQIASALARLGADRAMVVHSHEGLDEISLNGTTLAATVRDGKVRLSEIDPGSLGLSATRREDLIAQDVADAARIVRDILAGSSGPHREIVMLNTAAALVVAGAAGTIAEGLELARESLDSGRAQQTLDDLARLSHEV